MRATSNSESNYVTPYCAALPNSELIGATWCSQEVKEINVVRTFGVVQLFGPREPSKILECYFRMKIEIFNLELLVVNKNPFS